MMGKGEEHNGGRIRNSTLADAFEALIGAMFLDSDLETVRQFIVAEAKLDLDNILIEPFDVNPKGRLQELLQAISPKSPTYQTVSETGPEHLRAFGAKVTWLDMELGYGEGNSKKEAETRAALDALKKKNWETNNA